MADTSRRTSILRGLVAVTLALTATGLIAGPASAHAQLVSTDPADGATISAPPATVTLTFDEALLADTETISINDENGNVVASQQATPEGSTVSVPWPAELTTGTFQVAYRVVSGDGHPVTGAFTFTIGGDASAAASSGAASSGAAPSGAASNTAAASAAPSTSAVPSTEATPVTEDSGTSGVSVALVILGAIAVLVLIVVVAVTMIRRRR